MTGAGLVYSLNTPNTPVAKGNDNFTLSWTFNPCDDTPPIIKCNGCKYAGVALLWETLPSSTALF
jgi:hypothetical protein